MVKLNRDTRNSDNSFCRDIDISFLLARIHFGQREWAFVNLHVVRSAQTLRPFFLEGSRSHLRPGRVTYILFLPSLQRQALNLLPEAQDRTRATVVRVVGHQLPHGLSGACRVLAARFCPAPSSNRDAVEGGPPEATASQDAAASVRVRALERRSNAPSR